MGNPLKFTLVLERCGTFSSEAMDVGTPKGNDLIAESKVMQLSCIENFEIEIQDCSNSSRGSNLYLQQASSSSSTLEKVQAGHVSSFFGRSLN